MKKLMYSLLAAGTALSLSGAVMADQVVRTTHQTTTIKTAPAKTGVVHLQSGDIAAIQNRLNTRGYDAGNTDGVFGPQTENALRRFQADNDLMASGAVTEPTLVKLGLVQKPVVHEPVTRRVISNDPQSRDYRSPAPNQEVYYETIQRNYNQTR